MGSSWTFVTGSNNGSLSEGWHNWMDSGQPIWVGAIYHGYTGSVVSTVNNTQFPSPPTEYWIKFHTAQQNTVPADAYISYWMYITEWCTWWPAGLSVATRFRVHYTDDSEDVDSYCFSYNGQDHITEYKIPWQQRTLNLVNGVGKTIEYMQLEVENGYPTCGGNQSNNGGQNAYIDDIYANFDITGAGATGTSAVSTYVKKSVNGGLVFNDVTPSQGGAAGLRGLHASYPLSDGLITALVSNGEDTRQLMMSYDGGNSWVSPVGQQEDLPDPIGLWRWPYHNHGLYYGTTGGWRYTTSNGITNYNKTGNFGTITNPKRIIPVWSGGS